MLTEAIRIFLEILQFMIIVRVIISWLPLSKGNLLAEFLYQVTEPILGPIRSIVARSEFFKNSMFDITPILAILLIDLIRQLV